MKKTLIICDCCGMEITGSDYGKLNFRLEGKQSSIEVVEIYNEVCDPCMHLIAKTIKTLFNQKNNQVLSNTPSF